MADWLKRVGELTAEHRSARAERFATLARAKVRKRRMEGYSDAYAHEDARWYRDRERGQRERPERVARCGAETLQITCQGCGQVHERRSGCGIRLLCVRCRGAIAAEKRRCFRRARLSLIEEAVRRGLLRHSRRGGRWSEKFLTLTAPHDPADSIALRIANLLGAWKRFLRKLNEHWKAVRVSSAEWLRVFEWTPGNDGRGHPHFHLWIFSPFLDRSEVVRWWTEAVREQTGRVIETVIVDLREVQSAGVDQELIKYLTKDITANGDKLDPVLYAEVYKALDGVRAMQASRGFMARAKQQKRRCDCGSLLPKQVQRVRAKPSEPE